MSISAKTGNEVFKSPPNHLTLSVPTSFPLARAPLDAVISDSDIPAEFDSREKWGSLIGDILNQGQCGSCWAFATSEVLQDRCSIESGKQIGQLSQQYLLIASNGIGELQSCAGGVIEQSFAFMTSNSIPLAASLAYDATDLANNPSLKATETCDPGSDTVQWIGSQEYCVSGGTDTTSNKQCSQSVPAIQKEIMTNGPVAAGITVFQDFETWWGQGATTVYSHSGGSGSALGGHAIKLIGWGTDDGTPYWWFANSWGASTGDDG